MHIEVSHLAKSAGRTIMKYYQNKEIDVQTKLDQSPVSEADIAAHQIIVKGLRELNSRIPVVSEEDFPASGEFNFSQGQVWLVDPLDGTKDFLKGTGDFTVNIALLEDGKPMAGVVYAPFTDELFTAWDGVVQKNFEVLSPSPSSNRIAGVSHFHKSSDLDKFLMHNRFTETETIGSSLKFCRLIEGAIDIYPRLGPTSQWDIAAGHALVNAMKGYSISDYHGNELSYGKPPILNPWFVAHREGLEWTRIDCS
ncbi:MAG: 3'(2'),5'-bisphosphate nucleotidase CysQ [Pseudobacteriovorax sp.]|nr:3'(2'),5'-bisphosphate nucleotidase CysQ [Pseudobacteriovorax sp.]